MKNQGVSDYMIDRIIFAVEKWYAEIRSDYQLGFGHSFFTSITDGVDEDIWFMNIVGFEIKPLLEEYLFD